jgi:arylsulfatase A-like enzyme
MNILLVTTDSLRADRLRSGDGLTPCIDAIAEEGVEFQQAITHGHGTPVAFPAILSGTYPMLYGGCSQLSPKRPILARSLREAGYETVAFTSNPHLFDKYGYEVGFDEFNQYEKTGNGGERNNRHSVLEHVRLSVQSHIDDSSRIYDLARQIYYFLLTATDERPYAPADEINQHVLDWLDCRESETPFFMWVHYMDSHYPFYQDDKTLSAIGAESISTREQRRVNRLMNESPERLSDNDVEVLTTLYDAETYFVDQEFGQLLDGLNERGLRDDTLVVVTSDHGEAFGEHGGFGHYKALYEELVRVPLVIDPPKKTTATVEQQVGLADLAPTFLEYAGVDTSTEGPFSGESLWPLIGNGRSRSRDERHVVGHGDPLGVRTTKWKYIWWDRDGDEPLDAELFDLKTDPDETTDVSDEYPEVIAAFDDYLSGHIWEAEATADALTDDAAPDIEQTTKDQLEALGYT